MTWRCMYIKSLRNANLKKKQIFAYGCQMTTFWIVSCMQNSHKAIMNERHPTRYSHHNLKFIKTWHSSLFFSTLLFDVLHWLSRLNQLAVMANKTQVNIIMFDSTVIFPTNLISQWSFSKKYCVNWYAKKCEQFWKYRWRTALYMRIPTSKYSSSSKCLLSEEIRIQPALFNTKSNFIIIFFYAQKSSVDEIYVYLFSFCHNLAQ